MTDAGDDQIGFDEAEELEQHDVVVLEQGDGTRRTFVLLAVVEHEGRTYALLSPRRDGDDGEDEDEILVTTCDEDPDGGIRLGPLEDEGVLDALEDVVKDLVGVRRPSGRSTTTSRSLPDP